MKRDMDLVRDILLYVENCDKGNPDLDLFNLPEQFLNFDRHVLQEHVFLTMERNLIQTTDTDHGFLNMRLLWDGHEFLANAREPEVWNAAKESAGHLSFGVFANVLTHLAINHGLGLLKSGYDAAVSRLGGS